ncbi:class I SAM-dependent methyltransferase [Fluoribacter gormanii]|uniref:class I SAM-dependent methyltransferase n=1 Tax=Fluoribacter gormanii TaxID=464 RepID=UPI0010412723|nr:class I SAM-dependent methyltransferase [Fluoribacter gormanii]
MPIISVLSQSLNQETSVLAPDTKSLSSAQNDPQVLKPNQVIKLLKSSARMKEAKNVFLYAFADIDQKAVFDFMKTLAEYPINTPDPIIAKAIYQWYLTVGMENKKGFPMTDKEYQDSKSANIAHIITSHLSQKNRAKLKGKALLDIGAGDCAMTYLVSKHLGMEGNAIDIQSEIDWGGENSSDKKRKNDYMAQISNHYIYDGNDLLGALKEKKFAVVMYNHSLHHFPSFQAQFDSLKQASQILEPGGILFLSEHANCFDDDILDLSHILLNLRYSIDKKQISSPEEAMKALLKFKLEYQSHYLSKNILDVIAKQLGLTLIKEEIRSINDAAKATFFCFVKKSPREELTYSPYFFDTDKASRLHHHIKASDQELPQRKYSAEL